MIKNIICKIQLLLFLSILLIGVQIINSTNGYLLNQLGIYPRHLDSLIWIFTAPFIHGSYSHLINNLIGFSIFSSLCLLTSTSFYLTRTLFIIVVSGILVWCFGRPAYHIGLSGLIFGLWAMLIARGFYESNIKSIVLSVVIMFFYGSMIFGLFSIQRNVSLEFHIAGVMAGILCAFWGGRKRKKGNRWF